MMINIFVLDRNLKMLGAVEKFQSLIWARRYNEVGQCEIALAATTDNISMFTNGYYIIRSDDQMVCRVQKLEIQTKADGANTLIITGQDVAGLLFQRIMRGVRALSGNVRTFIIQRLTDECISDSVYTDSADRYFTKANGKTLLEFSDPEDSFSEVNTDTMNCANLGEKIQQYCKAFFWGYSVTWDRTNSKLCFNLYKGKDRSNSVLFSPRFDNLSSSKYVNDLSKQGNVAVVSYIEPYAGYYVTGDYGTTDTSIDRYEFYVSGNRTPRQYKFSEVETMFPGGSVSVSGKQYLNNVQVQIFTAAQKAQLLDEYSGTIQTIDGVEYFVANNLPIANLPDGSAPDDPAILLPIVYDPYLYAIGQEKMKTYGKKETFSGSVVPDVTFKYKEDYFLGDIVKVENQYGISANARIVEVLEVLDDNGYSLEPKFEYQPPTSAPIYGVSGLYASAPALTRTDDAVGMSFAINSSSGAIDSDFNEVFPWNVAEVVDDDAGKFVSFPEMYFRIGTDNNGRITDVAVSEMPSNEGTWYKVDPFLYGCYGASVSNNKMRSVSGVDRTNYSRVNYRTRAFNNGDGYLPIDLYHRNVLMLLWWIEFATKDSSSIMTGRIYGSGTSGGTSRRPCGGTDSVSTPSGYETKYGQMRYHYIEDFIGNVWEMVDGIYMNGVGGYDYVTANPSNFSDDTTGKTALPYVNPSNNEIAAYGWDDNNPFLFMPIETVSNNSYNTYFYDRVNHNSGNPVMLAGARYDDSSAACGLSYVSYANASGSSAGCGSRLLKIS